MRDLNKNKSAGNPETEDLITLKELCALLSVSAATGRNWLRQGRLNPQKTKGRTAYFSSSYAASLKKDLLEGRNPALKSRRNKKYVTGNSLYSSYAQEDSAAIRQVQSILDCMKRESICAGDREISYLTAEYAIRLLLENRKAASEGNLSGNRETASSESHLEAYLNGRLTLDGYEFLIDDLLSDRKKALHFVHQYPELFRFSCRYEKQEDLLGLLYISLRNMSSRKACGSYYTPAEAVRGLCGKLFAGNAYAGKKVLDPCCGTGSFLLGLPDDIPLEKIYGNDMDAISVKITRINLALKYTVKDKKVLTEHITNENYLDHSFSGTYDYIIGNPPWGFDFSEKEKAVLRKKYRSAENVSVESYDLFIEQALHDLCPGGIFSFLLPEAVLNVKIHEPIRKLLAECCSFRYLEYMGNNFNQVQCPVIILQAEYTGKPMRCAGMEIRENGRSFRIGAERCMHTDCFSFQMTDEEYAILQKIKSPEGKCFLKDNAVFALGIVTGDNRKYVSKEKNAANERILKGSDICRYRISPSENYVAFQPETFRQCAPFEIYRAPEKLLYRFICRQLVFAYDDRQTLSLNSCNVVIPQISGLSIRYVLAVLNSGIAQYFFRKSFNSVKVLRSHIEQIPIPYITEKQQEEILGSVEVLLTAHDPEYIMRTYEELDRKLAVLYGLTDAEYAVIKNSMEGENLFFF